jgi:predicted MFS family arabinose efflux permease
VFMKAVDQEHESPSVVRATALYTLSWSSGAAAGPFVAGVAWSLTGAWQYGYVYSGASALAVSVGVLTLRRYTRSRHGIRRQHAASTPPPNQTSHDQNYTHLPDLAWLGWVGSGAGMLCFFLINGMFPVTANHWLLPKDQQGMVMALMLSTQALTGLLLGLGRFWMYRRLLVAMFGLCGAAGLVLYAFGQSLEMFCLAAVCFGMYSGSFFFYLVFHAIIHPHRSARYVSINEAVVGVCGFVGPMAGGLLADAKGLAWPYLAAVGLIAVGVPLKVLIHTRFRTQIREVQKIL